MQLLSIVNCSATKSDLAPTPLRARSLPKGSTAKVAKAWRKKLEDTNQRISARRLYTGRGFQAALRSSELFAAKLYVVSAGMGVISVDDQIPTYDLTIRSGVQDSVLTKLLPTGRHPQMRQDWWGALVNVTGGLNRVKRKLQRDKNSLLVIGLTRPYLEMCSAELALWSDEVLGRVRIVGPRSAAWLPVELQSCVMPYDSRLNGDNSPYTGIEADYAQRALAHFLQLIHRDTVVRPITNHAWRVRLSLARFGEPERVIRRKVSDSRLKKAVREIRKKGISSASAGLRILRNDYRFACEQRRFAAAWNAK